MTGMAKFLFKAPPFARPNGWKTQDVTCRLHVMTADAILTDGKCGIVIMASAAGLTLLHVIHGRPFPAVTEPEYAGMAVGATIDGEMK